MEITGKVIQVLPIQEGISKTTGNPWKIKTFIIETQENFPRKVAIEMFGEQRINDNPCEVDQVVTVSFDLESREFNARWYTSVRAWKVQQGVVAPAQQPMMQTPGVGMPSSATTPFDSLPATQGMPGDPNSDLPF